MRFTADGFESGKQIESLLENHEMELISEDPPRVTVMVSYNGDELHLTFDETVSVVDVHS